MILLLIVTLSFPESSMSMILQCMGAEVKQEIIYSTAEMMEEEDDYSANFIDGQLPSKFHMKFKDEHGFGCEYSVGPQPGIERKVAAIARFANSPEVITKTIMAGCHKLYTKVMKKDFPSNPSGEKLVVTKGDDSKFSYEGREGRILTFPGYTLREINAAVSADLSIESFLWILSELALKYYGRQG